MPRRNGRFTPSERSFIEHMASSGGNQTYAAKQAGYKAPQSIGSQLMAKPEIRAAVIERYRHTLTTEGLPLAWAAHKRLLTDAAVPAGAKVAAVKLVYDQTLGVEAAKTDKEPSEMTFDELQASIEQLQARQAELANEARDVTPAGDDDDDDDDKPDLFG